MRSRHFRALTFSLCLLSATGARAEPRWVSLGLEGGHVTALAVDPRAPDTVLAAADEGGIWRSTAGASWTSRSVGMNASVVSALRADLSVARRWWAATNLGLFRSDDDGDRWVLVPTGLTGPGAALVVLELEGSALYVASNVTTVGANATVRRSMDAGATWQVLTIPVMDTVTGFAARGAWLLAASWSGLWTSTDAGVTWTQAMAGLPSMLVDGVALDPAAMDTVYASTTLGLAISTDRGMTFTAAAGGLPAQRLEAFAVTGAGLFASQGLSLFRSTDRGVTWAPSPLDARRAITAVAGDGARLFGGARGTGLFSSTTGGAAWAPSQRGFTATYVTAVGVDPARPEVVLVGTRTSGTFRSADRGQTWAPVLEGESPLASTDALALQGDVAWAVVNTPALASGKLLRSADRGASWVESAAGLPGGPYRAFAATPTRTLINRCFGDIFASDATGATFTALGAAPADAGVCIADFASDPGGLFASSGAGAPNDGVLASLDDGATWSTSRAGLPVGAIPGPLTFAPGVGLLLGVYGSGGGLFVSRDRGASWAAVPGPVGEVRILLADPARGVIYAATSAALYVSPDRGATWNAIDFGLPTLDVSALALGEGQDLVWAGTRAAGVHVYRDPDAMMMMTADGGADGGDPGGVLGRCGCGADGGGSVLAAGLVLLGRRFRTRRFFRAETARLWHRGAHAGAPQD